MCLNKNCSATIPKETGPTLARGIIGEAVETVMKSCKQEKAKTVISMGTIARIGTDLVKASFFASLFKTAPPENINVTPSSMKQFMTFIATTLEDPFETIFIARDLAAKCSKDLKQEKPTAKRIAAGETEFGVRFHCASVQDKLVKELVKKLSSVRSAQGFKLTFDNTIKKYSTVVISTAEKQNYQLWCPFMDSYKNGEKRTKAQERIKSYVANQLKLSHVILATLKRSGVPKPINAADIATKLELSPSGGITAGERMPIGIAS